MKMTGWLWELVMALPLSAFGDTGAAFESGPSVRATTLGDSVVSETRDGSSVLWNPGGLAHVKAGISGLRYRAFETDYTAFQAATRMGNVGLGVGYLGASLGGIPYVNRVNGRASQTGNSTDYGAFGWFVGAGLPLTDTVSVGVTGKYLQQALAGYSANGVGIDVGMQWDIVPRMSGGVLIQNAIVPQFKWNTASGAVDEMATRTIVGASVGMLESVTGMSQVVMQSGRPAIVQWGIEWEPLPELAFRAGHNNRVVSVGTGIQIGNVAVDFGWSSAMADGVDDIYRVGVGYGF